MLRLEPYLPENMGTEWQEVSIPLTAFSEVKSWGKMENLFLAFTNEIHGSGVVSVDNIEFHKNQQLILVDDFESFDSENSLGRDHRTFVHGSAAINGKHTRGSPNGIYRISYGGNIGAVKPYASDPLSFANFTTDLGGSDVSKLSSLTFQIWGAEGGEKPDIYLGDGIYRWPVDIEDYAEVTTQWQKVTIPLGDFAGVDLTHLERLDFAFQWEKMSGTVYLDEIRFEK